MAVTREEVLTVVRDQWPGGQAFTTSDVAARLDVPEHQVRAVVGWLVAGGVLTRAGRARRRDAGGRPYAALTYVWTGRSICRVTRDPEARRPMREPAPAEAARLAASLPWGLPRRT